MKNIPTWQYDESSHAGVNHNEPNVVSEYDEKHLRFRDYQKETENILQSLGLGAKHTVIDIGCGSGAFVLNASPRCKKIYAVDVSDAMLQYLRQKAEAAGCDNIEFCHGGFLTYEHTDAPVDAIVSVAALHHLPDFWKLVGLRRIAEMLNPKGRMYLFDIVFPFEVKEYAFALDEWVSSTGKKLGTEFAQEAATHIRQEYSTCDWIMEGILDRAGFVIDEKRNPRGFETTYICTRKKP